MARKYKSRVSADKLDVKIEQYTDNFGKRIISEDNNFKSYGTPG